MRRVFNIFARALLFGVLLSAAFAKSRNRERYEDFVGSLRQMEIIPAGVRWIAGAVVSAEWLVAVLLVVPALSDVALLLAAALMVAFGIALLRMMPMPKPVSCACFGESRTAVRFVHVLRNAALATVAVSGSLLHGPAGALPSRAAAAVIGLICAALIANFDSIVELFSPPRVHGR